MKRFNSNILLENFMPVPWISETEFRHVGNLMASSNVGDWQSALDILTVWKARQGRRLQDVFDLSIAILGDLISIDGTGDRSGSVGVYSASLTIVRFVGLLTEGSLKDKIDRASVLELAINTLRQVHSYHGLHSVPSTSLKESHIGIPGWIVDLRHDIVHKRLPSVGMVNKALFFAKLYVCDNFWLVETNRVERPSLEELHSQIRGVLHGTHFTQDERRDGLKKLFSFRKCICVSTVIDEVINYLLECLQSSQVDDVAVYKLPSTTLELTSPVRETIRKCGMQDLIIRGLLARLDTPTSDRQSCAVWILHFLSFYSGSYDDENGLGAQLVKRFLLYPSLSSAANRLLKLLNMQSSSELTRLVSIYQGQGCTNDSLEKSRRSSADSEDRVYRLADVQLNSSTSSDTHPSVLVTPDRVWQLANDIDWASLALGALPVLLQEGEGCDEPTPSHGTVCDSMDCGDETIADKGEQLWTVSQFDTVRNELVTVL